jgi:uncharacterized membrane protein (UPF0182 family)
MGLSRRSRNIFLGVVGALVLISLTSTAIGLYADWLWYGEVNYTGVFSTVLTTRALLFLTFGSAVALVVGLNLGLAFRLRPVFRPMSAEQQGLERYRMAIGGRIRGAMVGFAVFCGLITALSAQGHWQTWLLFANSTDLGRADPQQGIDASFYVFEYPFWRYLLSVAFAAVVLAALGALFIHYLYGGVRLQSGGDRMTHASRAHLAALLGVFVALKAAAYQLDKYGLPLGVNDNTGLNGASYTDVNALLPAKNILLWVAVICALVFGVSIAVRNILLPGVALALLGLSAVIVGGVYPAVVEQFTVRPNPQDREAEYISRNIDATRFAYNIAGAERKPYPDNATVQPQALVTDTATVKNIRLLDPSVLSQTYSELRQVKGFYDFSKRLDVDRYVVNNKEQDYVVGARELNSDLLQDSQKNWQNRHTVYTHGYGLVAAPANRVDANGLPVFVSGDFSGSNYPDGNAFSQAVPINEPRIYYGELVKDYAIVGKSTGQGDREIDRPVGDDQAAAQLSTTYSGRGGVPVGSFLRRLVYATYFREPNLVLSSVLNDNSKILYVRNPRDRVQRVAPFLQLDGDPYPTVVNGRVLWVVDGYTTSNSYPYSQRRTLSDAAEDSQTGTGTARQPREQFNYIRNSVKATVDAYDGTVTLYSVDDSDPVLRTWNKAFGNIVKPQAAIPDALRAHFRYPEDLFKVQRDVLAQYHVTNGRQFFSGQDFWSVPVDPSQSSTTSTGTGKDQPPFYVLAQFPGQTKPTFQLITSFTPRSRDNLAALLSASSDADDFGRLRVVDLRSDNAIPGPNQVQNQITSPDQVKNDLLSFGSGDSSYRFGNLLTLPVGNDLLYVEPLYVQRGRDGTYPILAKVLASFNGKVAYANTVDQAIADLLSPNAQSPGNGTATNPSTSPTPSTSGSTSASPSASSPSVTPSPTGSPGSSAEVDAAVKDIDKALKDLAEAQRTGNYAGIGQAQQELANAIARYERARGTG